MWLKNWWMVVAKKLVDGVAKKLVDGVAKNWWIGVAELRGLVFPLRIRQIKWQVPARVGSLFFCV